MFSVAAGIPQQAPNVKVENLPVSLGDGHMTSEEIERHLEAKQSLRDLIPEKTPLTVPVELFSNEPSVMEWFVYFLLTVLDICISDCLVFINYIILLIFFL